MLSNATDFIVIWWNVVKKVINTNVINKKNVKLDGKLKEKMSLFYAKLILMVLNDSVLDCS